MQQLPRQEPIGLLVAAVRRLVKQAVGRTAARRGLSSQQFWFLVGIAETGGLAQGALAERLRTDAPTASRVVAALVTKGLVRASASLGDRRCSELFLTKSGAALARELLPMARRVREATVQGLPEAERQALRRSLRRVIGNLEQFLESESAMDRKGRPGMNGQHGGAARRVVAVLGIVAALAVNGACSRGPAKARTAAVPVSAGKVEQRDVPVAIDAIGTVEAYSTVSVRPQVSGLIASVHFVEGADVRIGDPLFTIDPRPFEAALSQAQAALARDRAQARNAEAEAARADSLFEQGILSKEMNESARASAEALAATVQADTAAAENARLQLGYCSVVSPVAGRTGRVLVQPGNVVQAVIGGPLVVIKQVEPVYVSFSVPEPRLAEVRRAAAAGRLGLRASIPNDEKQPAEGRLSFVDNEVDRTTGTLRLKGTFQNSDRRLWPGQFVTTRLVLDVRKGTVVAPSGAVQAGQQGAYVYVVKPDSTAEVRKIVVGAALGDFVVVEKGLSPGETVVTDGQLRVVPGIALEVKKAVEAVAAGKAS